MKSLVSPYYSKIIVLFSIALTACGGSGSDSEPTTTSCVDSTSSFSNAVMLDLGKNSGAMDAGADISSDGLSLYFHSDRVGSNGAFDIYVATRSDINSSWSNVVQLGGNINTVSDDRAPNISTDGLTLLFVSDRAGGQGGEDIYSSTRNSVSEKWGTATNIGALINTQDNDSGPSLSADSLQLFHHSDRPSSLGLLDIYVSNRATVNSPWSVSSNLNTLNSTEYDVAPDISADNLKMYFHSTRNIDSTLHDIFRASRSVADSSWSTPIALDYPVNTSHIETGATIAADECELYFSSTRPGSDGRSIWRSTR